MDEEQFKKIIVSSWVDGDRARCLKQIKELIETDFVDKHKLESAIEKEEELIGLKLTLLREELDFKQCSDCEDKGFHESHNQITLCDCKR